MNDSSKPAGQTHTAIHIFRWAVLFFAIAAGSFVASKGQPLYVLAIPPLVVGVALAFNYNLLLFVTLFGGLVVSGLVQLYLPQLQLVRWAFSGSATLLLLHVAIEAFKNDFSGFKIDSAIIFWSLIFILVLILSAVLQDVSLKVSIVSLKGYLQLWGAYIALALLPWKLRHIDKFPAFILLVSLIQIPFVLHQYLVLVPMRMHITDVPGLVPIDIVSGTFGGKIDHGGANAALTLLCFITGAGLTSLWKNKVLAGRYFLVLIILVMFPAFVNSTKVSILYLFIALFIVFSDELVASPLKFLSRLLVVLILCLVVAFSVISSMPESSDVNSLSDLYEHTYSYNIEEENIRDNNLSRSGTIKAWLNPVKPHGFKQLIIGYGIGASRIIESDAGRRISSTINLEEATGVTALAAIIWETGIIGLLAVTFLFAAAFQVATKLKRIHNTPYRRSIFTGLQCAVAVLFVSLGHKSFFIYHIGFQTIFVVVFGYLAYWERNTNDRGLIKALSD